MNRPAGASSRIPFDDRYWDTIAARVFERRDQGALRVLIPSIGLAKPLRAAMAAHMQERGATVAAIPRITTLAEWIAETIIDQARAPIASETARRLGLFDTLRRNAWLASGLAAGGPAAMWAMARQLIDVGDELSRAAFAAHADVAHAAVATKAAIAAHFRGRAQVAASPEAELVLGVWRASAGDASDPVAAELCAMHSLVEDASQPLLVIRAIGPQAPHEAAFLLRYGERAPVEVIEVDVTASLAARPAASPLLIAAWPELRGVPGEGDDRRETLLERAGVLATALATTGSSSSHIACVGASSLEEEATAAASQIIEWLASVKDDAPSSIALIALDRLVARRVRALLERAKVMPVDESGWRLSTTTAAGALMRWLDLASPEGATCETAILLDWAKSGFAWADLDDKAELVATIERAVRAQNVSRGWDAVLDAIGLAPRRASQSAHDQRHTERRLARMHVRRLHTQATVARGRHPLTVFFDWLRQALIDNGMHAALRSDRIGAKVLDAIEALADGVAASTPPATKTPRAATRRAAERDTRGPTFTYAEWRGLIADTLESTTVRDTAIDSPVTFTSLSGAAMRHFDAVVIVGADASHFPTRAADAFFLTPGLRADLGLGRREEAEKGELATLAVILAQARHALVTWQAEGDGEARLPASAIERMLQVERMAGSMRAQAQGIPQPHRRDRFAWALFDVEASPVHQPAPSAPILLPTRITASQANAFVSCPYRYFARSMLGLTPLDQVSDEAEKRDYGQVVHGILEDFHVEWATHIPRADPADEDRHRGQRLREISEAVFADLIAGNPDYLAWRARWMALVTSYIGWWREWTDEGWRFGAAEAKREVALDLGDHRALTLAGRLDRVDRSIVPENPARIAILDYKARSKAALKKELVEPGEDVQLPFYRLLMRDAELGDASVADAVASYISVDRAKVDRVSPEQPLDRLSQAVEKRLVFDFRRLHQGASMRAQGIEQVCSRCDMRGLCRKGAWVEGDAPVSVAP